MQEQPLEFYRHFFTENLFLFPDQTPKTAPTPISVIPENEVDGNTLPQNRYTILGENNKGLVIVVTMPDKEFQSLPEHEFLNKVLASIKYSSHDMGYLNLKPQEKVDIYELSKQTQVNHVLAFGQKLILMSPESKIQVYKPASIGSTPLLLADPLAAIENDVNKKKALWQGLQGIFLK